MLVVITLRVGKIQLAAKVKLILDMGGRRMKGNLSPAMGGNMGVFDTGSDTNNVKEQACRLSPMPPDGRNTFYEKRMWTVRMEWESPLSVPPDLLYLPGMQHLCEMKDLRIKGDKGGS